MAAVSRISPYDQVACSPSATNAIDPNRRPPPISAHIIAPQSQITAHSRPAFTLLVRLAEKDMLMNLRFRAVYIGGHSGAYLH